MGLFRDEAGEGRAEDDVKDGVKLRQVLEQEYSLESGCHLKHSLQLAARSK